MKWPSVPGSSGTTDQGSGQTGKGAEGAKNLRRPGYHKRKRTAMSFRIGTWNVRTMQPGLDNMDIRHGELRKTAVIDKELQNLDLDIVALQETRIADSGSRRENNFTFYWKGLDADQPRHHGVGFAIRNKLIQSVSTPTGISERIMSVSVNTTKGQMNLISAYAPTLCASSEDKDKFYDALSAVVSEMDAKKPLYILGDFNARVGNDHQSWPRSLGHHGIGKMNENGQRLLEFCTGNDLAITNTFFALKNHRKVSWRHPRSGHWHQIDFVITRRKDLNSVKITRAYHSADCDTDHTLIASKVKITPKRLHMSRPAPNPKINVSLCKDVSKKEAFRTMIANKAEAFRTQESVDETWSSMEKAIYETAKECYGEKKTAKKDWVEANAETLMPLIEKKRKALLLHKKSPNQQTKDTLREAKADLQRESRRCANEYWTNLSTAIQTASDCGDTKTVHNLMNIALGPKITKVAKLKAKNGEPIEDKKEQLQRWIQHYSELYSAEKEVNPELDQALPSLPVISELDDEPTKQELLEALNSLPSGKATGEDNIPAEVLKENSEVLLQHLHSLLLQCWRQQEIPHKMRNAKIVTLYKNKGDKGDCNNYRGISLLSITGKVFARIILKRLQKLAEQILPESQCGFRAGRSTTDMIFTLRQLQEKCREQQKPLYIAFVDLTKAFDTVNRKALYKVLKSIGCPPILLHLIVSFHENMEACVQYDGSISDYFQVNVGVKQGCVLAPTLFGIYFAVLLRYAFRNSEDGVYMRTRLDGSLFNLRRLKAKKRTIEALIRDLLFADDAALTAHSNEGLQSLMNSLARACELFGLTISIKKTEVLGQKTDSPPRITLQGNVLNTVDKFVYLGSTISSTLSLEEELSSRIGKAATAFGKLRQRALENTKLTTKTKILVYQACVLLSLLYGSETWTLYARQEKRLNSFHMRCLRKILGIKWQDKIPDTEVLEKAGIPSLFAILRSRRLRWLGHVSRMDDSRIPKQVLYGELSNGKRSTGRPKLRYKDQCKATMTDLSIDSGNWDELAKDRSRWRSAIHKGAKSFEAVRTQHAVEARQRRKEAALVERPSSLWHCRYCQRPCNARIGLYSHERYCSKKLN